MQIFVKKPDGKTVSLNVESSETIYSVKRKLEAKEGIPSDVQTLTYEGEELGNWANLDYYRISKESTLQLLTQKRAPHIVQIKTVNGKQFALSTMGLNTTIDDLKAKIYEQEGIPPEMQSLIFNCQQLDGNQTLLENHIRMNSVLYLVVRRRVLWRSQTKIAPTKATTNTNSSFGTTDAEVTEINRNKEKELEATISELTRKNKLFFSQCASYEREITTLKAENKKTKRELMVARSKEKEQEATISRLTHKNKVFSGQCATYENQVLALEAENMKTKEELSIAAQKYYSGGRAAGYAEGLKEGKAKRLKSVEFLHHLTDASMQYFDYGFESCQKQAEEQGFVGQLNKDSALKEAPELKGSD